VGAKVRFYPDNIKTFQLFLIDKRFQR